METKQKRRKVVVSLLALVGLLGFLALSTAGDLEPSGPPGPTMKTLDEVEPRIPISQADIPLMISTPGSYYLTEDVTAAGTAITVAVDDVTIDLSGFALVGPDSGTNYGIHMIGRSNMEIRNGTVRDFYYGILEGSTSGQDHRVIDVRSVSNGKAGIYLLGSGHLVKDCTASDNGTSAASTVYGIYAGYGCTVTGNTAQSNGTSAAGTVYGIHAYSGCMVTGNMANSNGNSATGTLVYGIYTYYGCTVTGNTARNNGNSATGTVTVYGIRASTGCTVTGNTARDNNLSDTANFAGIRIKSDCLVKGNTLVDNMQKNIYVYGEDNAIEENLVTDSNNGIYFKLSGNFYANNRASGNVTDYNDVPGNYDGGGNVSF